MKRQVLHRRPENGFRIGSCNVTPLYYCIQAHGCVSQFLAFSRTSFLGKDHRRKSARLCLFPPSIISFS
jgi:hypothetical protein